jgi:O-antigen ligase
MLHFARRVTREPLWIIAALWPLALLAPFVPGLPRATNSGMTWRQELVAALLLCVTLALRARRTHLLSGLRPTRLSRALVLLLAAFVVWAAASLLYAANTYAALHYTLTWGAYLLFFLLLREAASSPRVLRASVTALALFVLIVSAANCIGYWTTPDSLIRQNGLGEPVAVSIPLFVALALRLRRARAALLCAATATVAWLSMLQISERAPFLGVCAGLSLIALIALVWPRFRPRSMRRAGLVAAGFVLAAALQAVPSPFSESRHQPILARLQATSATEENTRARFLYWGAALEMLRTRPLTGVGAANYDSAFPSARAAFAARYEGSPLVGINERFLPTGAHNEYLQILSELGAVGLALFVSFCLGLVWMAARALSAARTPLVPGAVASLLVFAISSGASSISFRWMGSGLVFFFAAALVSRFASAKAARADAPSATAAAASLTPQGMNVRGPIFARPAALAGCLFAFLMTCAMCAQAANVLLLARAQQSAEQGRAERLYRAALASNPLDPATHFGFGMWLYARGRDEEAASHLRYAVARGFNTSTCYVYLARAEEAAGNLQATEETLRRGVEAYPQSVFLRVRHAAALSRLGKAREADVAFSAALLLNSRAARGWYELINNDIDAAIIAARRDAAEIAMPGELQPEDGVYAVLDENERRLGEQVSATGWRARMRNSNITTVTP